MCDCKTRSITAIIRSAIFKLISNPEQVIGILAVDSPLQDTNLRTGHPLVAENVPLIGRPDHGPGGGRSSTRARLPSATVSRHDLGALENVSRLAGIDLEKVSPLMGGRTISLTVL